MWFEFLDYVKNCVFRFVYIRIVILFLVGNKIRRLYNWFKVIKVGR